MPCYFIGVIEGLYAKPAHSVALITKPCVKTTRSEYLTMYS